MIQDNLPSKKIALLLVNLGSPKALTVTAVRAFLKQFLWDRRVVNLPRFLWWFILHLLILPFRPRKSLKSYKKIWLDAGSPLTLITQELAETMQLENPNIVVDYAMSYGEPTIANQLIALKKQNVSEIIVLPLYPQYSSTTTASVYDAVIAHFKPLRHIPSWRFISDYHQHPSYITAIASSIQQAWRTQAPASLLLMSFHGLPKQLTAWGDPYYHQCLQTATLIAQELGLNSEQWQCVFQSRFGRTEWLQPYCIETLIDLPKQGIKDVDIVCPGFAVDCLETLEEIAMTNKDIFLQAGGESYRYIPALNTSPQHLQTLLEISNIKPTST